MPADHETLVSCRMRLGSSAVNPSAVTSELYLKSLTAQSRYCRFRAPACAISPDLRLADDQKLALKGLRKEDALALSPESTPCSQTNQWRRTSARGRQSLQCYQASGNIRPASNAPRWPGALQRPRKHQPTERDGVINHGFRPLSTIELEQDCRATA
jgi:hypothetical protein